MATLFRALASGIIALLGGFDIGLSYADRTARPLSIATPSIATIAYFRTLDLCDGEQPTQTSIVPVTLFGTPSTTFSYRYRCPNGFAGTAFDDMPLVRP